MKVQSRDITTLKVVISGAGAAGVACANILLAAGISDVIVLDSKGIISGERSDLNDVKAELAARTNPRDLHGGAIEALEGADVFLGVSAGKIPEELIASMAPESIVFALSNPDPEIHPETASKYAAIVATGRSDFPNQINNVLAFPGVFKARSTPAPSHHRRYEARCRRGNPVGGRRRVGGGQNRPQPTRPSRGTRSSGSRRGRSAC